MPHLISRASSGRERLPFARRLRGWLIARGEGPWIRRVRWGRIARLGGVAVVGGYLGLVLLAFGFVRFQRKLDRVHVLDMALPWRWQNYRVARGDQHVAAAQRFVIEGKFREALLFARTGVAQSPANREGRLLLVDLFVGLDRLGFARQTLLEGLRHHEADAHYLRRVCTFLLHQQEDDAVIALAEQRLPRLPVTSEAARVVALAAASAAYFRGNYDQAEDSLRRVPALAGSPDGRLLAAKIENDRGYAELALLQLRQLASELPDDPEIHRALVHHLRQQTLNDEARRACLAFQIGHPNRPGPRLELLYAYQDLGDATQVNREADAFLRDFGRDAGAVLALGEFAANAGVRPLVRRVTQHAAARGFAPEPFAFLAIEAAIVAGDHAGALAMSRVALARNADWSGRYLPLFDSLQAIAHVGAGDPQTARPLLLQFLAQRNLRADNLLAVANRFASLNATELGWQTLQRANEIDPRNQAVLARLIEFDLLLNRVDDLSAHVQRYLQMRRPSPAILRVARQKMGSDLFLLGSDNLVAVQGIEALLAKSPRR